MEPKIDLASITIGNGDDHMGGVMRIMGVPDDKAQQHDDERLILNEEFVKYVEQINEPRPADQSLH